MFSLVVGVVVLWVCVGVFLLLFVSVICIGGCGLVLCVLCLVGCVVCG